LIRLSTIIRDPFVATAFRRAERDADDAPVEVPREPRPLAGGAAEPIETETDQNPGQNK
jgi:hypothetical protein